MKIKENEEEKIINDSKIEETKEDKKEETKEDKEEKIINEGKKDERKRKRPRILPPTDVTTSPPRKRKKLVSNCLSEPTKKRASFLSDLKKSFSIKKPWSTARRDNKLSGAERIKATDGTFLSCFFTKAYVFSNHFMKPRGLITVDGVKYICTEQYYMYYKARVFGDTETAEKILRAPNARTMKQLGSSVAGFNQEQWRRVALTVMAIASLRKYEQNPELRALLFDTEETTIVEASPDDVFWGVGVSLASPKLNDRNAWRGQNVLGRILMKQRQ